MMNTETISDVMRSCDEWKSRVFKQARHPRDYGIFGPVGQIINIIDLLAQSNPNKIASAKDLWDAAEQRHIGHDTREFLTRMTKEERV